ncbi:MAG: hypothetical protein AB7V32_08505, partial [Candidatus Berkiella sp.]
MSNLNQNKSHQENESLLANARYNLHPSVFGKVAVLYGGRSSEREISLQSGENILNSLQKQGVNAHGIDVDENLARILLEDNFDRVFIAL